jgi:hypothetical protein
VIESAFTCAELEIVPVGNKAATWPEPETIPVPPVFAVAFTSTLPPLLSIYSFCADVS